MGVTTDKAVLRVLAREALDPPPIWLMRQAGRYLPEYRAVRAKAGSFLDLCFSPELAAEVTLQPIRRFGFDAAIVFADILLVPHGLGQRVWFEDGEGPRLEPIVDLSGLRKLAVNDVLERVAPVLETVRRVKAHLPDGVVLIGFAGAPWTVATYMIAGRGGLDQAPAKITAYRDAAFIEALLDILIDATIAYLSAQVAAGVEVVQLFDTWAGGLSGELFERMVLEPTERIVTAMRARHPSVPVIGFPRGIGYRAVDYVRRTGLTALSLSTGDDLQAFGEALGPDIVLQGGLDPLVLWAGGSALERATNALLSQGQTRPYIFNLGHGIVPQTPPEHVARLVELVRQRRR